MYDRRWTSRLWLLVVAVAIATFRAAPLCAQKDDRSYDGCAQRSPGLYQAD
jgi:hypothetical protein